MKKRLISIIIVLSLFVTTIITSAQVMAKSQDEDLKQSHSLEITENVTENVTENDPTEPLDIYTDSEIEPEEDIIQNDSTIDFDDVVSEDAWISQNRINLDVIYDFEADVQECKISVLGDLEVYSPEEAQEKYLNQYSFLPSYRDIYYRAPSFLIDSVDKSEYNNWYNTVIQPHIDNNIEPEEMYAVSFVKYFKIPKEKFEEACEEKRKWFEEHPELYDSLSDEGLEIPNADIIYTFDNDIINEYYRR